MNQINVPFKSELKLEVVNQFQNYKISKPINLHSCNTMGIVMGNCLSGYRYFDNIYFVTKGDKIICAIELATSWTDGSTISPFYARQYCTDSNLVYEEDKFKIDRIAQIRSKNNNPLAVKHSIAVENLIKLTHPEIVFDIKEHLPKKEVLGMGDVVAKTTEWMHFKYCFSLALGHLKSSIKEKLNQVLPFTSKRCP